MKNPSALSLAINQKYCKKESSKIEKPNKPNNQTTIGSGPLINLVLSYRKDWTQSTKDLELVLLDAQDQRFIEIQKKMNLCHS
jgi:hypothetical protein